MPLPAIRVAFVLVIAVFALIELTVISFLKSLHRTNVPIEQLFGRNDINSTFLLDNIRNVSGQFKACSRSSLIGQVVGLFQSAFIDKTFDINPKLLPGGHYKPTDCAALTAERTAIIIPFRNRGSHLVTLLNHLHPVLQRQELDYTVFVVEQAGRDWFNKGLLMNIGFVESTANETVPFTCFIFHDVDLLVEDDRAVYECREKPFHLSEFVDKFRYKKWTGTDVLFGGVVSIRRYLFQHVNGFSTVFFGWGAEDDEMRLRLKFHNISIEIPTSEFYRFKMLPHTQDKLNPWNERSGILLNQTHERMRFDGLNSLRYTLVSRELFTTHTHIVVSFEREEINEAVYGTRKEDLNKFASI